MFGSTSSLANVLQRVKISFNGTCFFISTLWVLLVKRSFTGKVRFLCPEPRGSDLTSATKHQNQFSGDAYHRPELLGHIAKFWFLINRRAFRFFVSFPSCVLMDFTPAMHRVGRGDNLWSMQWLMKSFWQEFGKIFAKVHAAIHKLLMVKFKRFHTQGFECGSCVLPRSLTVCGSRVGKPPPWCAHHHGAPHNFFILQPQSSKIGLEGIWSQFF